MFGPRYHRRVIRHGWAICHRLDDFNNASDVHCPELLGPSVCGVVAIAKQQIASPIRAMPIDDPVRVVKEDVPSSVELRWRPHDVQAASTTS